MIEIDFHYLGLSLRFQVSGTLFLLLFLASISSDYFESLFSLKVARGWGRGHVPSSWGKFLSPDPLVDSPVWPLTKF